jgi:Domain of unknown function (DUF4234)
MAQEIQIPSVGSTAKTRNIIAVPVFAIITLGIYLWFWWYFIHRELRDYGKSKNTDELGTSPGTSVLAITLGALIIVPAIISIVRGFKRVQASQRLAGQDPINGWIGLVLIIVFSPAFYAYMQSGLNSTWNAVGSPAPEAEAATA